MFLKKTFMLFILGLSIPAFAKKTTTVIANIVAPEEAHHEYLVYSLVDREVYFASSADHDVVQKLSDAYLDHREVVIESDEENNVISVTLGELLAEEPTLVLKDSNPRDFDYEATNFTDAATVKSLFRSLRRGYHPKSQCYQRAHWWSYKMWKKSDVKSMKVFLFFTKKYIRAYRYKWWFHVAPYVLLNDSPRVVDRTFTNGPRTMQSWTNNFMRNNAVCPIIEKYSDYSENQFSESCYISKMPMYFYQPKDILSLDRGNPGKTSFTSFDIRHARRALPRGKWKDRFRRPF